MHRKALEKLEETFGENHLVVANSYNNIATVQGGSRNL
jgi:hypothetical protein